MAQDPSWWSARGVLTNLTANDYAPAVAGQLKWIAEKAKDELDANLPGGSGTGVAAVVSSFTNSQNYAPVVIGQLKHTAAPFYDRLIAVYYATNYPWTTTTDDDKDYAPALIGQVKNVFSFDVTYDTDGDGMPDWWEIYHFGSATGGTASADADTDGLNNLDEFQHGANPNITDTDADGFDDFEEISLGSNPANPADGAAMIEDVRALISSRWNVQYQHPLSFTNMPGSSEDLSDLASALNALSDKFFKIE